MEIDAITTALNEYTQNKYGFNLRSAHLLGETCQLEFSYKDGSILDKNTRNDCSIFIMKNLPAGFVYTIKFVKNYINEDAVKDEINKFTQKNFPAFVYEFEALKQEDGLNYVSLKANTRLKIYVTNKNLENELKNYLHETFASDFEVKINYIEDSSTEEVVVAEDLELAPQEVHEIKVSDANMLFGEKFGNSAGYIRDQIKNIGSDVVVCGKIEYLKLSEVKSKKDDKKEENIAQEANQDETNEPYVRKYLKFKLEDFTGSVSCIYFATKTTIDKVMQLEDGNTILVKGTMEENSFNNQPTLKIKSMAMCKLPENFKEEKVYKTEPEHYKYCFPEPYVSKTQVDLFSVLSGAEEEVPEYLKKHDVVVFDFETTGLSATDCFIIEIGAVKIRNGKIIESFETFVNPQKHIDDDSTLIHGITDEDVKDAPIYPQALADFYKFTRNSTLVAYNIAFDYSFLSTYGEKAGYKFDNPQIDALKLATKNVHGTKNYKLKTVADHLGVLLDNAHRAVYDAIATAEVFIKLAGHIGENGEI
ncbi:MAG: ribonuclease H-like domain-containing protein [Clostridia bacterium]|nr:ribonuclease H-like domain-containing protein [Clostridia bacterium]